jgi:hypothetical protein
LIAQPAHVFVIASTRTMRGNLSALEAAKNGGIASLRSQ